MVDQVNRPAPRRLTARPIPRSSDSAKPGSPRSRSRRSGPRDQRVIALDESGELVPHVDAPSPVQAVVLTHDHAIGALQEHGHGSLSVVRGLPRVSA